MNALDKKINAVLSALWPPDEKEGPRVRFHSQNLNEDASGRPVGPPWHGRCWLAVGQREASMEWCLGESDLGAYLRVDPDRGLCTSVRVPLLSLYGSLPIPAHKLLNSEFWGQWNERYGGHPGSHRYADFEVFNAYVNDWALCWSALKFDWGWSNKMPRWMDGHFNFLDALLGAPIMTERSISRTEVEIPMPEGNYPATLTMCHREWRRPRAPLHVKDGTYAEVKMKVPIPHAGKGENAFDCGADALYSLSCAADTLEEAIAKVVAEVRESRRRYDGNADAEYPAPSPTPSAVAMVATSEAAPKAESAVSETEALAASALPSTASTPEASE